MASVRWQTKHFSTSEARWVQEVLSPTSNLPEPGLAPAELAGVHVVLNAMTLEKVCAAEYRLGASAACTMNEGEALQVHG